MKISALIAVSCFVGPRVYQLLARPDLTEAQMWHEFGGVYAAGIAATMVLAAATWKSRQER